MEILSQQSEGAFMVRQSNSNPGCYALTMKAPNNKILNYLIENVPGGMKLQVCILLHVLKLDVYYCCIRALH